MIRYEARSGLAVAAMGYGLAAPCAAISQSLVDDAFAAHIQGDWSGSGMYEGTRLDLTRSWTLELGGQFLRADMAVSMPNGASFGALMYWRASAAGEYEVVWLDGMGRMQSLLARADPASRVVATEYLDDLAEGGPEERRWEYERTGPDTYIERLFRREGTAWELLTEWSFSRTARR